MSVLDFLGEILLAGFDAHWHTSRSARAGCSFKRTRSTPQSASSLGNACTHTLATAARRSGSAGSSTTRTSLPEERELTAHSALTLARRSGDWALVDAILATWRTTGEVHKRFYRDAAKAHAKHQRAFEQEPGELGRLAIALNEHPNPDDARKLLSLSEFYADRGGAGLVLHARADAHQALGEQAEAHRAEPRRASPTRTSGGWPGHGSRAPPSRPRPSRSPSRPRGGRFSGTTTPGSYTPLRCSWRTAGARPTACPRRL